MAQAAMSLENYPPIGTVIDVGGLNVHFTDEGAGEGPPVVLLHGASANLRDWRFALSRRLAEQGRRVIAMDRPGFGYSERGPGDWPPARQAAQLRIALKKMRVTAPPIVVGHSWGAAVALAWALDAPVAGAVAVSGASMPWGFGASALSALGVGRLGVEFYNKHLRERAASGAVEAFVRRVFRPQAPPEGYVDFVGAALALRPATMAANGADLANLHVYLKAQSERYAALTAPVEIIHGDRDWLLGVERHAQGLAARLPKARVAIAGGVGHMAHHARPDLLEAAIARLSAR